MIRCTQIVPTLCDANAGPTYSVSSLAASLSGLGCSTKVLMLDDWRGNDPPPAMPGVELSAFRRDRRSLVSSLGMSTALHSALRQRAKVDDIFHSHGLWLMPNIYPALAARSKGSRTHVVHSPRGMLGSEALKFSALKKKAFWLLAQRAALQQAGCIHATAPSEYDEVRAAGIDRPVCVIPNGIALPPLLPAQGGRTTELRTVITIGRIHPKKALDQLILAWARLDERSAGWQLKIIGPDESGHADELRGICRQMQLERVSIEGPIHGADKERELLNASLFVLPTLNENFAMSVAEALAHGVPVISTKGAPWSGLEQEQCGWWVDHGADSLAAAMERAMAMPDAERSAMGGRGREWMRRDFSWEHVATQMLDVYRWLAGSAAMPHTVRLT